MNALLKNKTIIMMGAPGVGKGTYSRLLCKRFNLPVYSTGDTLRNLINFISNLKSTEEINAIQKILKENNSNEIKASQNKDNLQLLNLIFNNVSTLNHDIVALNKNLDDSLNKGLLIDNRLVNSVVAHILKMTQDNNPDSNSLILDGYPRTIEQARELEDSFKRKIDLVINVEQDDDIIVKKLNGRRSCKDCGASYNLAFINERGYYMPSLEPKKVAGKCDECGGELITRNDDIVEVIQARLESYHNKCRDILNFYKEKGVLNTLILKKGVADFGIVADLVENKLIH